MDERGCLGSGSCKQRTGGAAEVSIKRGRAHDCPLSRILENVQMPAEERRLTIHQGAPSLRPQNRGNAQVCGSALSSRHLEKCGGCCNSEGLQCMNISSTYISKTLFEITIPLSQGPKPVTISFANHTSCRCMSKLDVYRQVHSIIRRSLPATHSQCHAGNKTCPKNHIWSNQVCKCIMQDSFGFPSHTGGPDDAEGFHDICGPNKELDEETCQCVCKGGLWPSSCGPHKELDRTSCQCMCKNKLLPSSCGPNKEYDEDKCQCVCKRTCPKILPLNPVKCTCECTESPNKCFLKGKRFHHQTCSCYRLPCTVRTKRCDAGFYFSDEVCRCVPTYWKRPHVN
ncbi:vascular endothelial growth factor C isoform X4 [Lissotriton helveticus]